MNSNSWRWHLIEGPVKILVFPSPIAYILESFGIFFTNVKHNLQIPLE